MTVGQASLWGTRTGAPLHPLLLALGRPGGEHGGVDGEGALSEVLVFEGRV